MAPWNGAIAQFEPRLIAEQTRDGVAAARAEGRHPGRPKLDQEKLRAALTLIRNGMSPINAARHVGLGRSTLYQELALIPGAPPRRTSRSWPHPARSTGTPSAAQRRSYPSPPDPDPAHAGCGSPMGASAALAQRSTLPSVVGGQPMILSAIAEK